MGLLIDMATQHAAQPGRQFMAHSKHDKMILQAGRALFSNSHFDESCSHDERKTGAFLPPKGKKYACFPYYR
ncbi:MAG: hypothetical protein JW874_06385 [Spirochaetales bacterium]|nr:hypothetical protein [Spirochaetales bacterium]